MTFSDGGRSTGEHDTVFMTIDRNSEVSGSTERGGVFGILVGRFDVSGVGGDEKESRVVGCTEAHVAWRRNDCDERFLECEVKNEALGMSFAGLIGPAMLRVRNEFER
jgi:hypothetical protein